MNTPYENSYKLMEIFDQDQARHHISKASEGFAKKLAPRTGLTRS